MFQKPGVVPYTVAVGGGERKGLRDIHGRNVCQDRGYEPGFPWQKEVTCSNFTEKWRR